MKVLLCRRCLLTISLISFLIFCIFSCSPVSCEVSAENGILDLRESGALTDKVVDLKGEFAFFWNEFAAQGQLHRFNVSEAETFMEVPAYWKPHGRGYGIYSLKILLPDDVPGFLGLKMNNVLENYSLYADGKLIHQAGIPGMTKETSEWDSSPALIYIPVDGKALELIFQVSVWNDKAGGLSRNLYLGDYGSLKRVREQRLAFDALIIGAVLLVGIYHLAMSVMLRLDKDRLLYFFLGLVFILVILFVGSKDELLFKTIFTGFNAALRSRFIYSALILSVPVFYCYIYFVFPEYFSKIIFRIVVVVSGAVWLIILLTSGSFYINLLIPLEIFSLAIFAHVLFHLLYALVKERRLIILAYLAGYMLLIAGVVFSMLDNYMLVPAWSPGLVFLVFGFFQTGVQAYSASSAYLQVKRLNKAFVAMEKETEKLYDLSYLDQLTSLANRRYLNEYMQKLWERNSLTGIKVGMIVVDIDFFKLYNDRYGHLAGDNCLMKVAAALRDSINRRGDFISRYGGEEFVAVITNCPEKELVLIAERLRKSIEALEIEHIDSDCSEFVTISAGISSIIPGKSRSWQSLFKQADDALYAAKRCGRNRVEISKDLPGS